MWHSYNAPENTRYSHSAPDFSGVIHIFHREWAGIRAAAAYLPGQKLAISAQELVDPTGMGEIVALILKQSPAKIVFHGLSDQARALIDDLSRQGLSSKLYVVFHGAPTQWHDAYDQRQAMACLRLAGEGRIQRLHVLKAGFDFPVNRLFRPMLFNMAPNMQGQCDDARSEASSITALVPSQPAWTKNLFTNILGAALSSKVGLVKIYADNMTLPYPLHDKVIRLEYQPDQPFAAINDCDVVLNVSTADCHPMVNLEAQAFGVPCLRGPLHLDALENHPYVALTSVANPGSVTDIRRHIDRILSVSAKERAALTRDYQIASDDVALRRYRDFLEL